MVMFSLISYDCCEDLVNCDVIRKALKKSYLLLLLNQAITFEWITSRKIILTPLKANKMRT